MRNHHEDIEKICDRVRLLVLTTREFLSNPSKEEAEQIVEECDRLALAILPLFKTERLATLPLLPLFKTERIAALALFDVALVGIQVNSILCRWYAVIGSGIQLALGITAIRKGASEFGVEAELELGSYIGARFDEVLYAAALMEKPSLAGWLCDDILSGGYGARQAVESSDPRVRKAWAQSSAWVYNNLISRNKDAEDMRVRDVIRNDSTMLKWSFRAARGLLASRELADSIQANANNEELLWDTLLQGVEKADEFNDVQRWLYIQGVSCATPYAAKSTGRDIIYLIAGVQNGAALRFYGGARYRHRPEVLILPNVNLSKVLDIKQIIDNIFDPDPDDDCEPISVTQVHQIIGDSVTGPLLQEWPDLKSISLVPVGAMQGLPYSSSRIGEYRFGEILDITIAPTAKTLLLATSQRSTAIAPNGVIVGDPSIGVNALKSIPEEVDRIAAIYGKKPDLLVTHSEGIFDSNTHTSEKILRIISSGDVVHLACHGSDPKRHRTPALAIGDGISFKDFERHLLKPGACVVLSACSVALDATAAPLAHLGFPTMLLSAGASSVIACSWPVPESADTVDFVVDIHRYLIKGCSASRALRLAVDNAVEKNIPPEIWSAFEAYGR
jgi:hypothetical protein